MFLLANPHKSKAIIHKACLTPGSLVGAHKHVHCPVKCAIRSALSACQPDGRWGETWNCSKKTISRLASLSVLQRLFPLAFGPQLCAALTRMFHELLLREHKTGNPLAGLSGAQRTRRRWACHRATVPPDWFPHLNGTSQGPTPEDGRKDDYGL